nr:MAG TPA: hypothetical protein [Caudoviricetes sp.]
MTKEQLDAMPILGSMKPFDNTPVNSAATCDAPFAQPVDDSDLPF